MLGEASTTAIVKTQNPKGFVENKIAAKQGGKIAGDARKALVIKTGEKVVYVCIIVELFFCVNYIYVVFLQQ